MEDITRKSDTVLHIWHDVNVREFVKHNYTPRFQAVPLFGNPGLRWRCRLGNSHDNVISMFEKSSNPYRRIVIQGKNAVAVTDELEEELNKYLKERDND